MDHWMMETVVKGGDPWLSLLCLSSAENFSKIVTYLQSMGNKMRGNESNLCEGQSYKISFSISKTSRMPTTWSSVDRDTSMIPASYHLGICIFILESYKLNLQTVSIPRPRDHAYHHSIPFTHVCL
jgi:hypothetical protein